MNCKKSKTLELLFEHNEPTAFVLISPDHDEPFRIDGYDMPDEGDIMHEEGITRVDIPAEKFFHIEVNEENFAEITIEDDPEDETIEFSATARVRYNFSELVNEFGVPDTIQAQKAFKYPPAPKMTIEYDDGDVEVTRIEVQGTTYTPD